MGHDIAADLPTFLFDVLDFAGGQPLLPSLKVLAIRGHWLEKSYAPSILAAVLSQTVQRLEIKFPRTPKDEQLVAIMNAIERHAQNLTLFLLQFRGDKSDNVNDIN